MPPLIWFSDAMIGAIDLGKKTETRRFLRFETSARVDAVTLANPSTGLVVVDLTDKQLNFFSPPQSHRIEVISGYGGVGCVLYVYATGAKRPVGFRLEIVSMRVERLRDIDEPGAHAEGYPSVDAFVEDFIGRYGQRAWKRNPWVRVIGFRKTSKMPARVDDDIVITLD